MAFSSFAEAGRCPEQYRAALSTSFRDNYELNMATYHTGGDGVKIQNVTDTCFSACYLMKTASTGVEDCEVMSD